MPTKHAAALGRLRDAERPAARATGVCVMSSPLKMTVPARTGRRPETVFIVVVLPAPLAPMRVTISPSSTVKRDVADGLDAPVVDAQAVDLKKHLLHQLPGRRR